MTFSWIGNRALSTQSEALLCMVRRKAALEMAGEITVPGKMTEAVGEKSGLE